MGKIAAKVVNIAIGAVALEADIDNFALAITPEVPVVTGLSDDGPRRVVGNYDYSMDISGGNDFAAGSVDATIFGMVGAGAGSALAVEPTGNAAGPSDPNYDAASVVLSSYKISGQVGGRVDFNATLQGNSALARNVA